ncbi:MAG TPA: hypothetical protein VM370_08495 [Candidatus Thermoplasmatota archaeon]|nr:hypothetical protein [Candidatus Thermoplasmatota archaeon]
MVAPLDKVKALLAALPAEDQAELRRYLTDILVTPDDAASILDAAYSRGPSRRASRGGPFPENKAEAITLATLEETKAGKTITYTFRQERVRCGKEGCWCQSGIGHGPYTYKYWREDGKLRKEYVGTGDRERPKRAPRPKSLRTVKHASGLADA